MRERAVATRDDGLVDLLDRLLGAGVVAAGDVTLSVAGIDLVYLNLRALLASIGTAWPLPPELSPSSRGAPSTSTAGSGSEAALAAARRPSPRDDDGTSPAAGASGFEAETALERFAMGSPGVRPLSRRLPDVEPEDVQRGLATLVLSLVDLLRQLMERQAIRRIEAGTVSDEDVERLGQTFLLLQDRMEELQGAFGIEEEDLGLGLDLGVRDIG